MYVSAKHKFSMLFLFILVGCAPKYGQHVSEYQTAATNKVPDYSNLFYWAAHPWKHDPSDSVPKPLRKGYAVDSTVDVFFIYPTTLTNKDDSSWNADINDPDINAKTDYSPVLYQASVFNEFRVFSPRYRQAHVRAYYTTDAIRAKAAFELAYQDVKTAFQYYLDHFNHGRPIIIASHSQGSTHAQRLLKEFFDNRPLQHKLVAAYVLGMYIPDKAFASLKICSDSFQTGCVIGWRTYKQNYEPDFVVKEKGTGLVVNPLTWTTHPGFADHSLNKGSILLNFNSVKKHLVGGELHDGILWIGRIHLPAGFLILKKNYHIADVNLFYINIREDVKRRVGYFWK